MDLIRTTRNLNIILGVLTLLLILECILAFEDLGQPLYLTRYIESREFEKAKQLSKVGNLPDVSNVDSYSGFFTVNKEFNSNLFFWFFPAENANIKSPLILWLNGGPGVPSLFGLFVENGPYYIDDNLQARNRNISWTKNFHVLYVDNPVGTGFSYTDSDDGYARNQKAVAENLHEMLRQFFLVFSEYLESDFYIMGESYAGKYIPALAYAIHTKRASPSNNFKGIAIGNGLCDPVTMLNYDSYLYQLGLIDRKQAATMGNVFKTMRHQIRRQEYRECAENLRMVIAPLTEFHQSTTLFSNYTGLTNSYNYLLQSEPPTFRMYEDYVQLPTTRRAIHVGNMTFHKDTSAVQIHLLEDLCKSVKRMVEVLLDHYKVLFYNGQLDIAVPYPSTVNFLQNVHWQNQEDYKNASRQIWRVPGNETIAGYVHSAGQLQEVLVRNSGHLVPHDQPEIALDLVTRFIYDQPFS